MHNKVPTYKFSIPTDGQELEVTMMVRRNPQEGFDGPSHYLVIFKEHWGASPDLPRASLRSDQMLVTLALSNSAVTALAAMMPSDDGFTGCKNQLKKVALACIAAAGHIMAIDTSPTAGIVLVPGCTVCPDPFSYKLRT